MKAFGLLAAIFVLFVPSPHRSQGASVSRNETKATTSNQKELNRPVAKDSEDHGTTIEADISISQSNCDIMKNSSHTKLEQVETAGVQNHHDLTFPTIDEAHSETTHAKEERRYEKEPAQHSSLQGQQSVLDTLDASNYNGLNTGIDDQIVNESKATNKSSYHFKSVLQNHTNELPQKIIRALNREANVSGSTGTNLVLNSFQQNAGTYHSGETAANTRNSIILKQYNDRTVTKETALGSSFKASSSENLPQNVDRPVSGELGVGTGVSNDLQHEKQLNILDSLDANAGSSAQNDMGPNINSSMSGYVVASNRIQQNAGTLVFQDSGNLTAPDSITKHLKTTISGDLKETTESTISGGIGINAGKLSHIMMQPNVTSSVSKHKKHSNVIQHKLESVSGDVGVQSTDTTIKRVTDNGWFINNLEQNNRSWISERLIDILLPKNNIQLGRSSGSIAPSISDISGRYNNKFTKQSYEPLTMSIQQLNVISNASSDNNLPLTNKEPTPLHNKIQGILFKTANITMETPTPGTINIRFEAANDSNAIVMQNYSSGLAGSQARATSNEVSLHTSETPSDIRYKATSDSSARDMQNTANLYDDAGGNKEHISTHEQGLFTASVHDASIPSKPSDSDPSATSKTNISPTTGTSKSGESLASNNVFDTAIHDSLNIQGDVDNIPKQSTQGQLYDYSLVSRQQQNISGASNSQANLETNVQSPDDSKTSTSTISSATINSITPVINGLLMTVNNFKNKHQNLTGRHGAESIHQQIYSSGLAGSRAHATSNKVNLHNSETPTDIRYKATSDSSARDMENTANLYGDARGNKEHISTHEQGLFTASVHGASIPSIPSDSYPGATSNTNISPTTETSKSGETLASKNVFGSAIGGSLNIQGDVDNIPKHSTQGQFYDYSSASRQQQNISGSSNSQANLERNVQTTHYSKTPTPTISSSTNNSITPVINGLLMTVNNFKNKQQNLTGRHGTESIHQQIYSSGLAGNQARATSNEVNLHNSESPTDFIYKATSDSSASDMQNTANLYGDARGNKEHISTHKQGLYTASVHGASIPSIPSDSYPGATSNTNISPTTETSKSGETLASQNLFGSAIGGSLNIQGDVDNIPKHSTQGQFYDYSSASRQQQNISGSSNSQANLERNVQTTHYSKTPTPTISSSTNNSITPVINGLLMTVNNFKNKQQNLTGRHGTESIHQQIYSSGLAGNQARATSNEVNLHNSESPTDFIYKATSDSSASDMQNTANLYGDARGNKEHISTHKQGLYTASVHGASIPSIPSDSYPGATSNTNISPTTETSKSGETLASQNLFGSAIGGSLNIQGDVDNIPKHSTQGQFYDYSSASRQQQNISGSSNSQANLERNVQTTHYSKTPTPTISSSTNNSITPVINGLLMTVNNFKNKQQNLTGRHGTESIHQQIYSSGLAGSQARATSNEVNLHNSESPTDFIYKATSDSSASDMQNTANLYGDARGNKEHISTHKQGLYTASVHGASIPSIPSDSYPGATSNTNISPTTETSKSGETLASQNLFGSAIGGSLNIQGDVDNIPKHSTQGQFYDYSSASRQQQNISGSSNSQANLERNVQTTHYSKTPTPTISSSTNNSITPVINGLLMTVNNFKNKQQNLTGRHGTESIHQQIYSSGLAGSQARATSNEVNLHNSGSPTDFIYKATSDSSASDMQNTANLYGDDGGNKEHISTHKQGHVTASVHGASILSIPSDSYPSATSNTNISPTTETSKSGETLASKNVFGSAIGGSLNIQGDVDNIPKHSTPGQFYDYSSASRQQQNISEASNSQANLERYVQTTHYSKTPTPTISSSTINSITPVINGLLMTVNNFKNKQQNLTGRHDTESIHQQIYSSGLAGSSARATSHEVNLHNSETPTDIRYKATSDSSARDMENTANLHGDARGNKEHISTHKQGLYTASVHGASIPSIPSDSYPNSTSNTNISPTTETSKSGESLASKNVFGSAIGGSLNIQGDVDNIPKHSTQGQFYDYSSASRQQQNISGASNSQANLERNVQSPDYSKTSTSTISSSTVNSITPVINGLVMHVNNFKNKQQSLTGRHGTESIHLQNYSSGLAGSQARATSNEVNLHNSESPSDFIYNATSDCSARDMQNTANLYGDAGGNKEHISTHEQGLFTASVHDASNPSKPSDSDPSATSNTNISPTTETWKSGESLASKNVFGSAIGGSLNIQGDVDNIPKHSTQGQFYDYSSASRQQQNISEASNSQANLESNVQTTHYSKTPTPTISSSTINSITPVINGLLMTVNNFKNKQQNLTGRHGTESIHQQIYSSGLAGSSARATSNEVNLHNSESPTDFIYKATSDSSARDMQNTANIYGDAGGNKVHISTHEQGLFTTSVYDASILSIPSDSYPNATSNTNISPTTETSKSGESLASKNVFGSAIGGSLNIQGDVDNIPKHSTQGQFYDYSSASRQQQNISGASNSQANLETNVQSPDDSKTSTSTISSATINSITPVINGLLMTVNNFKNKQQNLTGRHGTETIHRQNYFSGLAGNQARATSNEVNLHNSESPTDFIYKATSDSSASDMQNTANLHGDARGNKEHISTHKQGLYTASVHGASIPSIPSDSYPGATSNTNISPTTETSKSGESLASKNVFGSAIGGSLNIQGDVDNIPKHFTQGQFYDYSSASRQQQNISGASNSQTNLETNVQSPDYSKTSTSTISSSTINSITPVINGLVMNVNNFKNKQQNLTGRHGTESIHLQSYSSGQAGSQARATSNEVNLHNSESLTDFIYKATSDSSARDMQNTANLYGDAGGTKEHISSHKQGHVTASVHGASIPSIPSDSYPGATSNTNISPTSKTSKSGESLASKNVVGSATRGPLNVQGDVDNIPKHSTQGQFYDYSSASRQQQNISGASNSQTNLETNVQSPDYSKTSTSTISSSTINSITPVINGLVMNVNNFKNKQQNLTGRHGTESIHLQSYSSGQAGSQARATSNEVNLHNSESLTDFIYKATSDSSARDMQNTANLYGDAGGTKEHISSHKQGHVTASVHGASIPSIPSDSYPGATSNTNISPTTETSKSGESLASKNVFGSAIGGSLNIQGDVDNIPKHSTQGQFYDYSSASRQQQNISEASNSQANFERNVQTTHYSKTPTPTISSSTINSITPVINGLLMAVNNFKNKQQNLTGRHGTESIHQQIYSSGLAGSSARATSNEVNLHNSESPTDFIYKATSDSSARDMENTANLYGDAGGNKEHISTHEQGLFTASVNDASILSIPTDSYPNATSNTNISPTTETSKSGESLASKNVVGSATRGPLNVQGDVDNIPKHSTQGQFYDYSSASRQQQNISGASNSETNLETNVQSPDYSKTSTSTISSSTINSITPVINGLVMNVNNFKNKQQNLTGRHGTESIHLQSYSSGQAGSQARATSNEVNLHNSESPTDFIYKATSDSSARDMQNTANLYGDAGGTTEHISSHKQGHVTASVHGASIPSIPSDSYPGATSNTNISPTTETSKSGESLASKNVFGSAIGGSLNIQGDVDNIPKHSTQGQFYDYSSASRQQQNISEASNSQANLERNVQTTHYSKTPTPTICSSTNNSITPVINGLLMTVNNFKNKQQNLTGRHGTESIHQQIYSSGLAGSSARTTSNEVNLHNSESPTDFIYKATSDSSARDMENTANLYGDAGGNKEHISTHEQGLFRASVHEASILSIPTDSYPNATSNTNISPTTETSKSGESLASKNVFGSAIGGSLNIQGDVDNIPKHSTQGQFYDYSSASRQQQNISGASNSQANLETNVQSPDYSKASTSTISSSTINSITPVINGLVMNVNNFKNKQQNLKGRHGIESILQHNYSPRLAGSQARATSSGKY